MLVTDQAKLIRMGIEFRHLLDNGFEDNRGMPIIGRSSSGVKLFDVAKGETVVGAALIDETDEPENEAEELVAEEMADAGSIEPAPGVATDTSGSADSEPED